MTNWAGNITYGTQAIDTAATGDAVRSCVRAHERMKVLGTRHSFNRIADSTDRFIAVAGLDDVSIDVEAKTVTVGAGITYGQLAPVLHQQGWALHNMASLPHISVAGSISTGTHGSGETNGTLASAVSAIEFVSATGGFERLSRAGDGETFKGAVVGLGALGVITRVTLDVQPAYMMRQHVYENMPLAEVTQHFDAIQASGYSVSLFWDWQESRINAVWIKTRVDAAKPFDAPARFHGATLAAKNLHPIAELSAEHCTEQLGAVGPWHERLPHFRMGFTPSAGRELQSEYFVPRRNAVDAILAVETLKDQIGPHLLVTEIRAIAADDLWMSPACGQDSIAIHFTWKPDMDAVSQLMPRIERALAPYRARPHWGKLFMVTPVTLRSVYPKLPAFVALAKRYDPQGKFRNAFLNEHIFTT
jgi:alditol oxidase